MTNTKKQVKQVTIIPARIEKGSELVGKRTNRRVAAYARVSTNRECQQTSYEAQIQYYTRYIEKKPDWIFAGIYADEGVTGTSTQKRVAFLQMIQDAIKDEEWAPNAPITIEGGWMMNEYGKEGPVPVHIKGKSSTKPLIDTGALRQNCQYVIKKGKK